MQGYKNLLSDTEIKEDGAGRTFEFARLFCEEQSEVYTSKILWAILPKEYIFSFGVY